MKDFEYDGEEFKKGYLQWIKVEDVLWFISQGLVENVKKQNTAGFHISALYAGLGWYSWNEAVVEYLEAEGEPALMQVFVNTVLGLTFSEYQRVIKAEELLKRREIYSDNDQDDAPENVVLLTCAVDTQDDRLEALVTGWGINDKGGMSWHVIDFQIFYGDPAEKQVWDDLDLFREKTYKTEDGRVLGIRRTAVDAGGHKTQQVYDYCRHRSQDVYAIMGARNDEAPNVSNPSKKKTKNNHPVYLHFIGTHACKSRIYSLLDDEYQGAGSLHFPEIEWCNLNFFKQLTSERLITVYKKGKIPTKKYIQIRARNEVLDLMVYNMGMLYYVSNNPLRYLLKATENKGRDRSVSKQVKKSVKRVKRSSLL